LGVEVNEVIPENGSVKRLKNITKAWFNIVPYREIGLMTAQYLEREFGIPFVSKTPMGIVDTGEFVREIASFLRSKNSLSLDIESYIRSQSQFLSQSAWFSRSIDCQNLTGKRGFVFGDATHAAAMTKILAREMGIRVCCSGTYCKHDADWFREEVEGFCDEVLITDDHTKVKEKISFLQPAVLFGSQMERHIGKRYDIPCGVISAPVHIQNFPLGYKPFLGYEGTNQIADLVYNSFTLGMEDHLLEIFGGHDTKDSNIISDLSSPVWTEEGIGELKRIPGFVRGKIKKNTERFAKEMGIKEITLEVLYAAKEAVGA
jgi:light-independent protochlorophyllide reductase subunit B